MKSRLVKKIFAVAMMAILFGNNVLPSVAETVSGGDAVIETGTEDKENDTQETVNPDTTTETEEEPESSVADDTGETDEEIIDETTVSGGDAEESEEEEDELLEDGMMVLDPVTVDGVTITVSGSKEAFKEGTTVSAKAVEPAEVVIEAAEENEQAVVKKYKAFDIRLMLDGKEVQPLNGEEIKVNFEGDMLIPDTDNNEDVAVYHVDGEDNLTKMDAEVAPLTIENETVAAETVEMTTTHFSTYVIIITGEEGECTVTYRHLLDGKEFYKPSEETVKQNVTRTYTDLAEAGVTAGGTDYRLTKIKVIFESGKEETVDLDAADFGEKEIKIKEDATIELQYEPIEKTERYENGVIFYDYSVEIKGFFEIREGNAIRVGNTDYIVSSINTEYIDLKDSKGKDRRVVKGETIENVSVNGEQYTSAVYAWWGGFSVSLESGEDINHALTDENESRYLIMGRQADRGEHSLMINGANGGDANKFEGGPGESAIVQGIVAGLTGDFKNVVWGRNSQGEQIVEPGYFTMDPVEGKEIYANDFKLTFDQTGNKYQLHSAASSQYGETYSRCQNAESFDEYNYTAGEISGQFFPLDRVPSAQLSEYSGTSHNWYFGMRYDFTFKLGDYIGDLLYTFEGDDDLWVFVDGTPVLDLGGIHKTYPSRYSSKSISNTVDLWETYFGVTKEQRKEENWWENANEKYDPEHEYQITVLYMERGAYASSCYMEFVLPNVESRKIDQNYGSLTFTKTDSKTGQPIAGAEFTLYNESGSKVKEAVSGSNGVVTFSGLTAGNYTLKETKAPEGYLETDKTWNVVVSENTNNAETTVTAALYDGQTAISGITNEPADRTIDIEFKKIYRYDHSVVLQGAEFTLKENDISGKVIATAVSGEDGKFTFAGLEEGSYFLEETKAPEGYRTPEAGTGLTIKVYEEDGALHYNITSNNSGQLYYMKAGEENLVKNVKGIDVTITKEWKDARENEIEETPVDKIEVELRRNFYEVKKNDDGTTTTVTRDDQLVKNITLTKENNWTVTLENLDYQCDGGVWNYYIVEKSVIDGYTPEYSLAAVHTEVAGAYSVELTVTNVEESGSLTITKKVDRVDPAHGDATFTFKISLLDDKNETKEVFYRTITFREAGEKTITVTGIPTGNYKVEELTTLRYTMEASSENGVVKKVTAESTPNYSFSNTKTNDKRYSHTDVLVNSFRMDDDGNITISKDRQVTEETEINAEN